MAFPDNILDKVSRLFDDGIDDILIYALVFLFVILSGRRDERYQDEPERSESGFPIVLIVIFLLVFLFIGGYRNEPDEKI